MCHVPHIVTVSHQLAGTVWGYYPIYYNVLKNCHYVPAAHPQVIIVFQLGKKHNLYINLILAKKCFFFSTFVIQKI